MKVIEIVVCPKGLTTIQTRGFVGSECQQASKFLEQALGDKVVEQITAEFYAPATSQQNEVQA